MTAPRLLIAGIGNIFLGDDAFGVEVAQRMMRCDLPSGVRVIDFGIRGLELTYALLDDGYEIVILVDAVQRGGRSGTLYVIEPEVSELPNAPSPASPEPGDIVVDTHDMDPAKVLRLVKAMGGELQRVQLVGCEPSPATSCEQMASGLSAPVRAAVNQAIPLIESLANQMISAPADMPISARQPSC